MKSSEWKISLYLTRRWQYELISQKYGQPVDVVKQVIPKAQLKPDLLRMKASQLIIDAAEIIMEESGK